MIRNFIFSIFFFLGIILISIIFLPAFFLPQKVVLLGGRLMGYWTELCLKIFLSIKIVIKGKENIINNGNIFYQNSSKKKILSIESINFAKIFTLTTTSIISLIVPSYPIKNLINY